MGQDGRQGLYDPRNEHDACGVGFVANIKGRKSHDIVRRGLQILLNLNHRGAVGADPLVGDGVGCLLQIPDALFRDWAEKKGFTLPPPGDYGVAMCFLPQEPKAREFAVHQFEHFVAVEGQTLVGWRDVPTDPTGLGKTVLEEMPLIRQAIIAKGDGVKDQDAFERKLLVIRKQTQNPLEGQAKALNLPDLTDLYMPSCSSRTIVYKGLLLARQLETFYLDLVESADGVGAGARSPAVRDQHVPDLEAGASLPLHRAQRRDQHRARQHELDERATAHDEIGVARA